MQKFKTLIIIILNILGCCNPGVAELAAVVDDRGDEGTPGGGHARREGEQPPLLQDGGPGHRSGQ